MILNKLLAIIALSFSIFCLQAQGGADLGQKAPFLETRTKGGVPEEIEKVTKDIASALDEERTGRLRELVQETLDCNPCSRCYRTFLGKVRECLPEDLVRKFQELGRLAIVQQCEGASGGVDFTPPTLDGMRRDADQSDTDIEDGPAPRITRLDGRDDRSCCNKLSICCNGLSRCYKNDPRLCAGLMLRNGGTLAFLASLTVLGVVDRSCTPIPLLCGASLAGCSTLTWVVSLVISSCILYCGEDAPAECECF